MMGCISIERQHIYMYQRNIKRRIEKANRKNVIYSMTNTKNF